MAVKRLLEANASDFAAMNAAALRESIRLSEGRTVVAEVMALASPLVDKVSNPELAAGMGADMLLLNFYDVEHPQVMGFPDQVAPDSDAPVFGKISTGRGVTLAQVKDWIGRPVGVNLEPIERPEAVTASGRLALPENARLAVEQGADFILLTGNPATGVTIGGLERAVKAIRVTVGEKVLLFAGKIHMAGALGDFLQLGDIDRFADAGVDGLVLPVPGTVPGVVVETARLLVEAAHQRGLLVMNGIGTSQEGASISTIEQLALMSKMTGADMHHIGDAGTIGIAIPENITAWSLALRGRRHTWHRMAASLRR
jgi:hypothetical protein